MLICIIKGCDRISVGKKGYCKICQRVYMKGYVNGYNAMKNKVYNEIINNMGGL